MSKPPDEPSTAPVRQAADHDGSRPCIMVTGSEGGFGNLGDEILLDVVRQFYRAYLDRYRVVFFMVRPPALPDDGFIYAADRADALPALAIRVDDIALVHYYGGGYLNDYWFADKIWLARELRRQGLPPRRLAFTGQGIGPLSPGAHHDLECLAQDCLMLGTRDLEYSAPGARLTFDDSIPRFGSVVGGPAAACPYGLALNVRLEDYVDLTPDDVRHVLAHTTRYLQTSGRIGTSFGMVRNERFDEGAALAHTMETGELGATCIERAPRPSTAGELYAMVTASPLAITTSYHVTLFALYAGRPVLALCAGPYYQAKFRGLGKVLDSPLLTVLHPRELTVDLIVQAAAKADDDALRAPLRARFAELQRLNAQAYAELAMLLR